MPRKAPDVVQEVRVTFGNAERKLIKDSSSKLAWSGVAKGVGSAVGGIGIAGAAIAALIYVGFNIDDFIDNRSTRIVTWLEKKGYVVYWAPVYGMKLKEAEDELAALGREIPRSHEVRLGTAVRHYDIRRSRPRIDRRNAFA